MTAFMKPRGLVDYPEIALEAAAKALLDAGINYDQIEAAYVGYVYGDSTSGQRALYGLGMTGIPIHNVNNNCSTGSTALYLANQMVEAGVYECTLALGFEKMEAGSLKPKYEDRSNPLQKTIEVMSEIVGYGAGPSAAQIFGNGGDEYCTVSPSFFFLAYWFSFFLFFFFESYSLTCNLLARICLVEIRSRMASYRGYCSKESSA